MPGRQIAAGRLQRDLDHLDEQRRAAHADDMCPQGAVTHRHWAEPGGAYVCVGGSCSGAYGVFDQENSQTPCRDTGGQQTGGSPLPRGRSAVGGSPATSLAAFVSLHAMSGHTLWHQEQRGGQRHSHALHWSAPSSVRRITCRTASADHAPPRAVLTPRSVSAAPICRSESPS
jgi:hypothetical protein